MTIKKSSLLYRLFSVSYFDKKPPERFGICQFWRRVLAVLFLAPVLVPLAVLILPLEFLLHWVVAAIVSAVATIFYLLVGKYPQRNPIDIDYDLVDFEAFVPYSPILQRGWLALYPWHFISMIACAYLVWRFSLIGGITTLTLVGVVLSLAAWKGDPGILFRAWLKAMKDRFCPTVQVVE